jgi:hypothetical protein
MKAHITYTASQQVSEDSWKPYTEVVDIDETDTIYEIVSKHFKNWKTVHVELHVDPNKDA